MFASDEYQMIDFGDGRRLERFGSLILDRICPAASGRKANPEIWKIADARFLVDFERNVKDLGQRGFWQSLSEQGRFYFPDSEIVKAEEKAFPAWPVRHDGAKFVLELKGSPFGHIGIFPEQSQNWDEIATFCLKFAERKGRAPKVLNLFAYTGGSTLAAAYAGAVTVHVDAAANIVRQARSNAALSFSEAKPIRWIVDDVVKFVRRELRRGTVYDGIILDPPAYGHGASGQVWRLNRDLPKLLNDLKKMLAPQDAFVLLTCHTDESGIRKIDSWISDLFPSAKRKSDPIVIRSEQNRALPAGHKFLLTK